MDNLLQFIGRLHPLIVHLPIGILMLTVGLHALIWKGKYAAVKEILPLLWFIGCVSAVFACVAGYFLSLSGGYDETALDTHMWLGIGLAIFSGGIFVVLQREVMLKFELIGVGIVALLLFSTGHYGGNLTHGEAYLTEPLYALIGQAPAAGKQERKPIANINEAIIYHDLVEPVLETKCYQCHSATKKKGKLRLDAEEFIVQGGDHGTIMQAGNPEKSKLYTCLILPEEDDKRMPPKGKPQLTENEVKLIYWWISKGNADFQKQVADVEKDDKIKPVLASFGNGSEPGEGASGSAVEIPAVKVSKPDPKVIVALEKLGVAFTSLTPDHTFLGANLVNTTNFTDQEVTLLLQLKNQLIWLDMSQTNITDSALPQLTQLKYLTRLSLDNTSITDAGITHLVKLPALRFLNLYGTKVTDESLKILEACKGLKVLYLWQTQVTAQGVAALQKARGESIEINFGSEPKDTDTL